jgi:NitT/TauT family transport system substrate-binding protein
MPRRKIYTRALFLLGLLCIALAACGTMTSTPEPLRLRLVTWPGYAPLYAVADHELAAPTQLEVSTSDIAQDNYRAFAEGRVDVLASTLFTAIQFVDQGTPTSVILVTDYSNGADGVIARAGLDSMADLEGQRVAVESGSISHFVLMQGLRDAGLTQDDIEVIHVVTGEAPAAIEEGTVDAAAVWEPVLSEYATAHNVDPLFTSAEIPNQVVDVLIVHPDLIEERPEDLANLVRGWDQAVQEWRAGSPEIADSMARSMNVSVDDLRTQLEQIELVDLEHNAQLFDPTYGDSLWNTYGDLADFFEATEQLGGMPPDAADILNDAVIEAALQ